MGILLLDFHFSTRSPPGLWECGNRVFGDFQGLWETMGNLFLVFLVFHSPSFPQPLLVWLAGNDGVQWIPPFGSPCEYNRASARNSSFGCRSPGSRSGRDLFTPCHRCSWLVGCNTGYLSKCRKRPRSERVCSALPNSARPARAWATRLVGINWLTCWLVCELVGWLVG